MSDQNYFFEYQSVVDGPMARRIDDWFFSAGIEGVDKQTGNFPDDPNLQAQLAFENLQDLLEQAGMSADNIGHIMVWQKDRSYREPLNKEWEAMFPDRENRPARHVVLRDWDGEALIKLEVIAIADQTRKTIVDMPGASLGGGANKGFIPLATMLGDVFFSSAVAGWDVSDGSEPDDPEVQTKFAFANVESLLKIGGFDITDVAHMFVWQRDFEFKKITNDGWKKYFPDQQTRPARHSIKIALPLNLATQLEVIAIRNQPRTNIVEMPNVSLRAESEQGMLPVATIMGDVMFTSAIPGTIGDERTLPEDIADEATTLFINALTALGAAGFKPENVAHVYVWRSSNEWDDCINEEWLRVWPEMNNGPVRHDLLAELPGGMRVQLELVAVRS